MSFTSSLIADAEKAGRITEEENDIRYASGALYAGECRYESKRQRGSGISDVKYSWI